MELSLPNWWKSYGNYIQKLTKRCLRMQNQPSGLFDAQSMSLRPALPLQLVEMPAYGNFVLPNFIASLHLQFQILDNQVRNLRQELEAARAEVQEVRQLAKTDQKQPTFLLLKGNSGKIRKEYTKHLHCPSHQCRNKYSSRIALRAHLRRMHPQLRLDDSGY